MRDKRKKKENRNSMQNASIRHYVEGFFEDVPFSEAAFTAKDRIIAALTAESARGRDFESLVTAYPTLQSLAVLAGYGAAEAETWRSRENLIGEDAMKAAFRKKRRSVYLTMIPLCIGLAYFAYILIYRSLYLRHEHRLPGHARHFQAYGPARRHADRAGQKR